MKKIFLILISVVFLISVCVFNTSALTVSDTYSDVASTSTNSNNLINMAIKYKSFNESKFVIFCDQQNSYYIVWSKDLSYNGSKVTGTNIEYVRYYRPGTTSSTYVYDYGTDSSFSLTADNLCTSNLDNFGMASATYEQYKSDAEKLGLLILIGSFLFVMMLVGLRGKS